MKCAHILLFGGLISFCALSQEQEPDNTGPTVVEKRLKADRQAMLNNFAITQHKANYFLPVSYQKNPNQRDFGNREFEGIDNTEAKFQISLKMPIYLNDDESLEGLYFGFTAMSLWQLYNSDLSKPFRETNYEPELFYTFAADVKLLGYQFDMAQVGINHQSNGQNQLRSRSWNRIFGSLLFSDQHSFYYLKAWYRIKEDEKESPLDPTGDDNPDITDFLGNFELGYGTKMGKFNFTTLLRNNLKTSDNKGSIELSLGYPITDRYDLVLKYFNGYGDSLIDYDHHQQRVSLGIQLAYF